VAARFLAIGDVMVDVVVSGGGHDAHVRLAPGGCAVNAALSAAQSGAEAGILGRVGDDPAGRMVQMNLVAQGVVTRLSVDPNRPTGTFLVVDGEIRVDIGANAGFSPEHLPPELEADATLVSGHLPEPTVAACLKRSRAPWNALAAARLTRLPNGGNAIFVNSAEAHALTGAEPAEAAHLLAGRYRLVCVTLGRDGAIGRLDGAMESARAVSSAISDDTLGTGDAFAAAVLVALSVDAPFRDALAAGCRAGALSSIGERTSPE
jgi:sugar/nucleoside kinase (ribokinase family)